MFYFVGSFRYIFFVHLWLQILQVCKVINISGFKSCLFSCVKKVVSVLLSSCGLEHRGVVTCPLSRGVGSALPRGVESGFSSGMVSIHTSALPGGVRSINTNALPRRVESSRPRGVESIHTSALPGGVVSIHIQAPSLAEYGV